MLSKFLCLPAECGFESRSWHLYPLSTIHTNLLNTNLLIFFYQDEDSVYRTLAAVLHLGDLKFTQSDTDMARLVNQEVLDRVSVLLQVSSDELGGAIMSETTYTRGKVKGWET